MPTKVVITVKNTTPLLSGWYSPGVVDETLGLRPTEIKGIWRWWCRAFVAGALFDCDLIHGSGNDVVLKPTEECVGMISEIVGKKMGLGYVSEGKKEVLMSRFRLYTDAIDKINIVTVQVNHYNAKGIKDGTRFNIVVELRDRMSDIDELALKILLVAIQFSGIGRRSRRGWGSLDIIDVKGFKVNSDISKVIDEAYNECLKNFACDKQSQISHMPPLPVVSKSKYNNMEITTFYSISVHNINDVYNFLKNFSHSHVNDAWILGLPRKLIKGKGFIIEYKIRSKGIFRRASPLTMTFHSEENIFGPGCFVSMMLSGDWPKYLDISGRKPVKLVVDLGRIKNAYKLLQGQLTSKFGGSVRKLWP